MRGACGLRLTKSTESLFFALKIADKKRSFKYEPKTVQRYHANGSEPYWEPMFPTGNRLFKGTLRNKFVENK